MNTTVVVDGSYWQTICCRTNFDKAVHKNAMKIILVQTILGLPLWAYSSRGGSYGLVLACWMRCYDSVHEDIIYGLLLLWIFIYGKCLGAT